MIKNPSDLSKYAFILVFSILLGNLTLWIGLKNEVVFVKIKEINPLSIFKGIMQLFIPVIAIQIYTVLDQTMIGKISNTTQVGYYSQSEKVIKLSLTIISSLSLVLLPRIANLFANDRMDEIKYYYDKALSFIFVLVDPMIIGCIVIAPFFVPIFYGNDFLPAISILRILSILFIVLSVGQLFGSFLVAMKLQSLYTKAVIIAASVNFILNFIMLYFFKMGADGAAIGTVVAELCSTVIQVYGARKIFDYKLIIKKLLHYFLPSLFMGILLRGIICIVPSNFVGLFLSLLFSVCIYVVILLIMKDSAILDIYNIFKKKFFKKNIEIN